MNNIFKPDDFGPLIKKSEVYQISDKQQRLLNTIETVQQLKLLFDLPTLTPKAKFVDRPETGICVIANEKVLKGEIVCKADSSLLSKPFKYSWQVDDGVHQLGPGALDHNCFDPTCELDTSTGDFVARRNINEGEILTFNYLTTELDMDVSFECQCGEINCFKNIRGFMYLDYMEQKLICDNFRTSNFIQKFFTRNNSSK